MNNENATAVPSEVFHRHLSHNESECIRRNITIRVEALNADRTVAFCTVEQRSTGLLRHSYSLPELVWRAEQALAPLNGLGILPMINVRKSSSPASAVGRGHQWFSPMDLIQRLRGWLGYPLYRQVFVAAVMARDPFGLHKALRLAVVR